MNTISNQQFAGERPLFHSKDLRIENVVIDLGESAIKECENIEAVKCTFKGKYPFWHVQGFSIANCVFEPTARAALWYSQNLTMTDTVINAPKMFRKMQNLKLSNITIPDAGETLWMCKDIVIKNATIDKGDYLLLDSENIEIENLTLNGNYSFQNCKNVVIKDSVLNAKDAFWESENVTVYNSTLNGEYLGWHSKNLRLVNCKISGTQPLCYAENLIMENCTMTDDADLAFEYSSVKAEIVSAVHSIKNPLTGLITAKSIGEIILDDNIKAPSDCIIKTL